MEQKSLVVKKGSDSDKQRYVRKSSFQRGGKEPALEQERPKREERDRPSADGREAERRGGRKRNGCCLSEASFIHFPTAAKRSSPDGAALTFWFFWVKPKERNHRLVPSQKIFSSEFFLKKSSQNLKPHFRPSTFAVESKTKSRETHHRRDARQPAEGHHSKDSRSIRTLSESTQIMNPLNQEQVWHESFQSM